VAKRWIRSADIRRPGPSEPQQSGVLPTGQTPDKAPFNARQSIWSYVSSSPLRSLWNLEGVPARVIARNTWKSLFADDLLGRSAELGFFFLFALFPTLFMATAILGLAARSAPQIYDSLLAYLAIVVPPSALGTVLQTFNETAAASTTGKLTFGLVAALWSASVGFSAIQDSLDVVYRVKGHRPYWKARLAAVGITVVLAALVTLILASFLCGDFLARLTRHQITDHFLGASIAILLRVFSWLLASALLSLFFALIYYFGPGLKTVRWHWLTPGSAIGILGWFLASLGLRMYVHIFPGYSTSYGSLGAVIILLTWFYLSGLMLLLGGEINSEIEAAVKERELTSAGVIAPKVVSNHVSQPADAP
jgi:membrane protein